LLLTALLVAPALTGMAASAAAVGIDVYNPDFDRPEPL
jgi:phage I-like protein